MQKSTTKEESPYTNCGECCRQDGRSLQQQRKFVGSGEDVPLTQEELNSLTPEEEVCIS